MTADPALTRETTQLMRDPHTVLPGPHNVLPGPYTLLLGSIWSLPFTYGRVLILYST